MRQAKWCALVLVLACVLGPASAADGVPADNPLLLSSGYLAGTGQFSVVRLGPDGALWLAGESEALAVAGSANPLPHAGRSAFADAFVIRLDPSTRTLLSGAWIGGEGAERIAGLDFDAAGRAYVAGTTQSPDFPVRGGDPVASLIRDKTFVARLSEDATSLEWVRTIGGDGEAVASALAMTDDGDPVVVGRARMGGFELVDPLPGTGERRRSGAGFATRVSADGETIVFSTQFDDILRDVSTVASAPGRLVLAGESSAFSRGLEGAQRILEQPNFLDTTEHVLVEIDQAGSETLRVAVLGSFEVTSLVLRPEAHFVAGSLRETPFKPGVVFTPEPRDAGILRLDPATWDVAAEAVVHGKDLELSPSLAIGDDGAVWLACETRSRDLPMAASIRPRPAGRLGGFPSDFCVATFDPESLAMTFSTYLGGRGNEFSPRIATVPGGGAWLAGSTQSDDFTVLDPHRARENGDGFVLAELRRGDVALAPNAPLGVAAERIDGPAVRLTFRDGGGGATGIAIDRQDEGRWTRVAVVAPGTTEWTDTDVLMDHGYTYALQAVNEHGGSPPSETAAVIFDPTLAVDLTRGQLYFSRPISGFGRGKIAGTVARLDGGVPDLRAAGFEIISYSLGEPLPLLAIPAGAGGWTERRGRLRYVSRTVRFQFDPATGEFAGRVTGDLPRFMSSMENAVQMRSGRDAGTTSDVWRDARDRGLRTP